VFLFFFWNDIWLSGNEAAERRAVLDPAGRPTFFDVPVSSLWLWHRSSRVLRLAENAYQRNGLLRLQNVLRDGLQQARAGAFGPLDEEAARTAGRRLAGPDPPLTGAELNALLAEESARLPAPLRELARTKFWPALRPMRLWTPAQRAAARGSEETLSRFAADVRADAARFVVMYVPNPMQVGAADCSVGRYFDRIDDGVVLPETSGLQEWLAEVSARHGFQVLDPTLAMRDVEQSRSTPLYLRYDCHWSPAGHAFVAQYLADWYIREFQRSPVPAVAR
jgi:hypothetical protein